MLIVTAAFIAGRFLNRRLISSGSVSLTIVPVEVSILDDLDARSIVRVWGRKSGDRIIADVLMHSNTEMIKRGLFEDCDVCP